MSCWAGLGDAASNLALRDDPAVEYRAGSDGLAVLNSEYVARTLEADTDDPAAHCYWSSQSWSPAPRVSSDGSMSDAA